ncbi:MAG: hypothetical protein ABIM64_01670 [candidate division WOR-3 bacterium]
MVEKEDWVSLERKRIEKKIEDTKKNVGGLEWLRINEGVTVVSIDLSKPPLIREGQFGEQKIFETVEPPSKRIAMSNALYERFILAVAGKKGIVKVRIIRTGKTKKDTKYLVELA